MSELLSGVLPIPSLESKRRQTIYDACMTALIAFIVAEVCFQIESGGVLTNCTLGVQSGHLNHLSAAVACLVDVSCRSCKGPAAGRKDRKSAFPITWVPCLAAGSGPLRDMYRRFVFHHMTFAMTVAAAIVVAPEHHHCIYVGLVRSSVWL